MVLAFFLPVDGSDVLTLCRVYSFFTAVAMFIGRPFIGAACSGLAVYILQNDSYDAKARNDGEILDQWMLLCILSAVASFGSWFFLLVSSMQSDESQSFRTYFLGYAVQKLWAIGLGVILYQDVRLIWADMEMEMPGKRRRSIAASIRDSVSTLGRSNTRGAQGGSRPQQGSLASSIMAPRNRRRRSSLATVLYELRIRVIQGKDLVAKDAKYMFGKNVTSDPYVVVKFGANLLGKTPYVTKDLNPTWPDQLFRLAVLPKSLEIYKVVECNIFDYDNVSADDAMGTVYIPIPPPTHFNLKILKWYKVEKGKGETFCHDAKGELFVEIEVVAN